MRTIKKKTQRKHTLTFLVMVPLFCQNLGYSLGSATKHTYVKPLKVYM